MVIERTCNRCKEVKPLNAFPPAQQRHGYKDNIRPICRACISISARVYREAHRDELRAHHRMAYRRDGAKQRADDKARRDRLKVEVFAFYGGACYCCGENLPILLCIDHKLNNGYEMRKKGYNGPMLYARIKKDGFPDDLQLACWSCNAGRHFNNGVCPHDTERLRLVAA